MPDDRERVGDGGVGDQCGGPKSLGVGHAEPLRSEGTRRRGGDLRNRKAPAGGGSERVATTEESAAIIQGLRRFFSLDPDPVAQSLGPCERDGHAYVVTEFESLLVEGMDCGLRILCPKCGDFRWTGKVRGP